MEVFYMDYQIRELKKDEIYQLENFLYDAIFIPDGVTPPERAIVKQPALQVYIENFGERKDDKCLVAIVNEKIIGAVWVRIMHDYGYVDNDTPSLAISVKKKFRSCGIGTRLITEMLDFLKKYGYKRTSLAVQKENYAVSMYKKIGYQVVDETEEEFIMVCKLQ